MCQRLNRGDKVDHKQLPMYGKRKKESLNNCWSPDTRVGWGEARTPTMKPPVEPPVETPTQILHQNRLSGNLIENINKAHQVSSFFL
jgi:hypothetical protein